ncbi:hypothetical protein LCGC14_1638380 [marine sediment metagenome]|uniref:ParB-like N-terminal domain-containing protein n=1 Tax=marine sediment metagenome TaxID=412755 RepID=A0A0F9I088_9ZZZZ
MELVEIPTEEIRSEEHSQRIDTNEEKLLELVGSIRAEGLLQPVSLKRDGDGYVVVIGHRRLEAMKRLGWTKIPAIIVEGDEASLRSKTFAENFFSENLTPVELAVAITDEYETGRMSVERMAAAFGRTADWVRRQIALCGWPESVLEAIHSGGLSIAAGSNLALIEEEFYRDSLVRQAVENGATARTTAAWLQAWRSMMPLADAVEQDPVDGGTPAIPMVPQAPCLSCHTVYRTDELSHVPLCRHCIKVIAEAVCT